MRIKNRNRDGKVAGDDFGPAIPYSLDLRLTNEQREALLKEPALIVMVQLKEPIERNGEKFGWFVHPIKFTAEGTPENLGKQIFCHDEAEAKAEEARLMAIFKEEEETRKRKEAERPFPGHVLKIVQLIRGRSLRIDAIPISLLPLATGKPVPASELPPDEPFLGIGYAFFKSANGNAQAALSIARETHEFIHAIRLIRYAQTIDCDGKRFSLGVELAECDLHLNALRVMKRWPCKTEALGCELFKKKETELREGLQKKQEKSEEEQREADQIRQVQVLADKAHDPKAKNAHLRRIEEIHAEQVARQGIKSAKEAEQACLEKEQHAAFAKLIEENFPTVTGVKVRMKDCSPNEMADWNEQLRRAMRVDCARLGIVSPFNNFALDGALAKQVTQAMSAKSPAKPDQIAAVLNWMTKNYDSMREEDWTADVANQIKAPVNVAGLGKTLSKKFGLKSKLRGRPETGSGKNAER